MSKNTAPITADLEALKQYLGNCRPPHWIRPLHENWDGRRWVVTEREAKLAAEKPAENLT
jgi:hypothetical protein